VNEYRVTKYNPRLRDESGAFTGNDWICVGQIGDSFDGALLTAEKYAAVEGAYVTAALAFLEEAGLASLKGENLERRGVKNLEIYEGETLSLDRLRNVIPRLLREEFWCRLQCDGGFVHIGWDYYMFIGVPAPCPSAHALAGKLGLYVEDFASPYHPEPD
jgi:hypothetical protein